MEKQLSPEELEQIKSLQKQTSMKLPRLKALQIQTSFRRRKK